MPQTYRYDLDERSVTQRWLTDNVWQPTARRLPRWISPNTITVAGAVCMLASLAFVRLALAGNRWGYLGAALCTLAYFTADNVDGPHARNTGRSSHLGEFLDHFLDTINGAVLSLGLALSLGLRGLPLLLCVAGVSLAFYATMWEQHRTGTMHSGRLGANEAILIGISGYLARLVFPEAAWLSYQPSLSNPVLLVSLLAVGTTAVTVARIVWRNPQHRADLLPLALTCYGLLALAQAGLLGPLPAAAGMLAANVMFSGSMLITRLTGLRSRRRALVVPCAVLLGIALALARPDTISGLLGHRLFLLTVGLLVLTIVGYDLLRATRALRAGAQQEQQQEG